MVKQALLDLLLHTEALAFFIKLDPITQPRVPGLFENLALEILEGRNLLAGRFLWFHDATLAARLTISTKVASS